jgi:hypothetical protein
MLLQLEAHPVSHSSQRCLYLGPNDAAALTSEARRMVWATARALTVVVLINMIGKWLEEIHGRLQLFFFQPPSICEIWPFFLTTKILSNTTPGRRRLLVQIH